MYKLRENRDMKPSTFASLVGTSLYEHRFGPMMLNALVIGMEDGEPVLVSYDLIGCQNDTSNFGGIGTAEKNFIGLCEAYYRDDLEADEMEDVIGNILVSGLDRDILSGWGGIVYVMTDNSVEAKYLKTKMI